MFLHSGVNQLRFPLRGDLMWHLKQIAITFLLIFASAALHSRSLKFTSLTSLANKMETEARPQNPILCQDFLDSWGQKPPQLHFIDCQKIATPQGDRSIASYTIDGADAAAIEAVLQHKFRMAPLQFVEGTWKPVFINEKNQFRPAPGEFVDDNGNIFEVVMASDKTSLSRRKDWVKVEGFKVSIIQHLEMNRLEERTLKW